ncbi:MAG: group III truncated hemoglobin [Verrucomicrobiales bacterium]|nr:group III truncated hemoglobin [Verrucomicrobiales bacterium]
MTLPDISGRPDIERIVNHFYNTVRADKVLGPIFDDVARTDWAAHLPKMYNFWETVLFGTGSFRGNPLAAHMKLVPLTDMGKDKFDHWLKLFRQTVGELHAGPVADHLLRCAEDMANVIYSRINAVPDPRFSPENLTPEQKARYAAYRPENAPATTA